MSLFQRVSSGPNRGPAALGRQPYRQQVTQKSLLEQRMDTGERGQAILQPPFRGLHTIDEPRPHGHGPGLWGPRFHPLTFYRGDLKARGPRDSPTALCLYCSRGQGWRARGVKGPKLTPSIGTTLHVLHPPAWGNLRPSSSFVQTSFVRFRVLRQSRLNLLRFAIPSCRD